MRVLVAILNVCSDFERFLTIRELLRSLHKHLITPGLVLI